MPCPTVHNSLSSVLAALTAEWDRLKDLHQGSELSRTGVRLRDRGAVGREGLSLREAHRPGGESRAGPGESVVSRGSGCRDWCGRVGRVLSSWPLAPYPLPAGL